MNIHDLKFVVVDNVRFTYFATREKNDRNGNPRYKVFLIDPDGGAVFENIFTTYNVEATMKNHIEEILYNV